MGPLFAGGLVSVPLSAGCGGYVFTAGCLDGDFAPCSLSGAGIAREELRTREAVVYFVKKRTTRKLFWLGFGRAARLR